MGTTTTNLNLYKPDIGEVGWGDEVDANFDTLDTTIGADVKALGAVGDGTTDDTTAINAAISAVASGGVVHFPPGTYKYVASSQMDIPSNVTLRGEGWGSILLISASGANGSVRFPSGNSNCVMRDMTLKRGNTTATRLLDIHAANCIVQNVKFDGNANAGTALSCGSGADGLLIQGNLFSGVSGRGIYAVTMDDLRIVGNRFQGHLGSLPPIDVVDGTVNHLLISGNEVRCDATATCIGILVDSTAGPTDIQHVRIVGNYVENSAYSIEFQKASTGTVPSRCSIANNTIKLLGGSAGGITLLANGVAVSGNMVDLNSVDGQATGIELADSNYCAITGNVIYGDASVIDAIILNGSSHNTVSGNTINGLRNAAGAYAIRVLATTSHLNATDNVITGNHIYIVGAANGRGIGIISSNASAHADRNVVVGNSVYGNGVAGSIGVAIDVTSGTGDRNLVGMNVLRNVATGFYQNGDTNTLASGTTWNLTA